MVCTMDLLPLLFMAGVLAPVLLMAAAALIAWRAGGAAAGPWRAFHVLSAGALIAAGVSLWVGAGAVPAASPGSLASALGVQLPALGLQRSALGVQMTALGLQASTLGLLLSVLVQLLGTVIGGFSARYLQGEAGQPRYVAALAAVLGGVHLLLLADHWVVLIAAWAWVGVALQPLLCFYPDRAFAGLAAHKKRLADRVADGLLIGAAALAWTEVGSGALTDLWAHVDRAGMSAPLQLSALALVLAVVLRTALLPVHGWLIQVMEAPTPVSALLHAGVVNLGGFVLIRFAPLLEQALPARALLLAFGLATAVLAGMVVLTRVSIKVRLAWSTVAQMGFMLVECALGLYTLAALHLIGHALYKAHAFLAASTVVRQTRLQALHAPAAPSGASLVLAPVLTIGVVLAVLSLSGRAPWPVWWSAVLGLAWAPLLWLSSAHTRVAERAVQAGAGLLMVAGLTAVALLAHALPFGLHDAPHHGLGLVALLGMAGLYAALALLQAQPRWLSRWRRWSYAGFYVDEVYTRLALQLWPARWTPAAPPRHGLEPAAVRLVDVPR